jgi:hypothetical protein
MRVKTLSIAILIIVSLSLSACGAGATAPASDMSAVQTIAAVTFQAMTEQGPVANSTEPPVSAATETSTPSAPQQPTNTAQAAVPTNTSAATVLSPASPATIYPRGSFVPYPATECELLREAFETALNAAFVVETVPFSDRVSGGTGTACRIHGSGNETVFTIEALNTLRNLLPTRGWTEDSVNYSAGGPMGLSTGFTRNGAIGLLSVGWKPSADANCPKDQPISMCPLTPEQKLYDVTFDVGNLVIYNPPTKDNCNIWLAAIQPALPVTAVLETVDFTDFEMYAGTACQVRATGTGANFANIMDTARAIDAILAPLGWTLVNGADGPTGTGREYTYGNMIAIVFVKWEPAPGANCPQDQPIGMCNLTPEQKLFTVTVALAEK